MARSTDTVAETRFGFGENWASYAELIDEQKIDDAEDGIVRLIDKTEIEGRSFLDIGCGSGIHALAAARLGARSIYAVDLDRDSVRTARALFERLPPDRDWNVENVSVFDLDPAETGTFDIVYSWGVLHHTGDVETAVRKAADMVASGGLFVFSLYRPTSLDWFWLPEKRWYAGTSPRLQRAAQWLFGTFNRMATRLLMAQQGVPYEDRLKQRRDRGMDETHDMHDWLGGWPYEPVSTARVRQWMTQLGFEEVKSIVSPETTGQYGSGCDEYVYRRAGKSVVGAT